MYSYLINRIDAFSQRRKGYEAPKGIHPYEVKSKAAAGIPFTLEEATLIRDHYFPGEALEDLFKKDAVDELTLTASECIRIMDHTRYWGEIMPVTLDLIVHYTKEHIQNIHLDYGHLRALAFALAIGRAAGVKEGRAMKKADRRKDEA